MISLTNHDSSEVVKISPDLYTFVMLFVNRIIHLGDYRKDDPPRSKPCFGYFKY